MFYQIYMEKPRHKTKDVLAYVSVVFGESFKVNGMWIENNSKSEKPTLCFPVYKVNKDGKNKSCIQYVPITSEFYKEFTTNVLETYQDMLNGNKTSIVTKCGSKLDDFNFKVRVNPLSSSKNKNLKGIASIHLNNCFALNSVFISKDKNNRLNAAMPRYKTVDSKGKSVYCDLYEILDDTLRMEVFKSILIGYSEASNKKSK